MLCNRFTSMFSIEIPKIAKKHTPPYTLVSTSKEPWSHTTSAQMTVIDRPVRGSCCHVCSWLDSLNVFSFATGWILSKMENSQHSILGSLLEVSLSTVSLIGGAYQSDLWLPEPNPATKVLYL